MRIFFAKKTTCGIVKHPLTMRGKICNLVIEGLPEVGSACTSQTFLPKRETPAIPFFIDIVETFCGRQARKQQI